MSNWVWIFIQNLQVKTMVVLCKSCRSGLTKSNKIGLAFFCFFYTFLGFFYNAGANYHETKINILSNRPLLHIYALGILQLRPPVAGLGRRRRGGAGCEQQMEGMCDWPHQIPIDSGGMTGGGFGERQWQDRSGAVAAVQIPTWWVAMHTNKRLGRLTHGLMVRLEG
jgi:hypothetical protein